MEELGRKYKRGRLVIPALLKDKESDIAILAVILDISAKGMRLLTNNKLAHMTKPEVLMKKTFTIEFDFFNVDTSGIECKITNVKPGLRHEFERQFGIEFTKINTNTARDINRIVLSQLD